MARRRSESRRLHKSALPALGLSLVLTGAAPVIASQNLPTDCPELEDGGLQVPIIKLAAATAGEKPVIESDSAALSARPLNTAVPAPLLDAPAEAISKPGLYDSRTPFVEQVPADDTDSTTPQDEEATDKLPDIQTQFPGVSSAELKRFKRQMYRRDI